MVIIYTKSPAWSPFISEELSVQRKEKATMILLLRMRLILENPQKTLLHSSYYRVYVIEHSGYIHPSFYCACKYTCVQDVHACMHDILCSIVSFMHLILYSKFEETKQQLQQTKLELDR